MSNLVRLAFIIAEMSKLKHTGRQRDSHRNKQTDVQTDGETDSQAERQTDSEANRLTGKTGQDSINSDIDSEQEYI